MTIDRNKVSGRAIENTNVKFMKLAKSIKELKSILDAKPDLKDHPAELVKVYYPDWEEMTPDEFSGKEWYIEERLLPLVGKNPNEVYNDMLLEEDAKLSNPDDVVENFGW